MKLAEDPIHREKRETTVVESLMSSAQRRKLADISNLQDQAKQMNREETQQQQNMLFSSQEYAEKLQKENMTLMKALAHRNKIIELSGVEFQKLRINLRNVQEKNLHLAQANSQMLAELNTNRDRLKVLQHELCCKNELLKGKKMQLEEQMLPFVTSQAHEKNHKDTKKKRTSRMIPSGSSNAKSIQVNEKSNSKRKVSAVIDTTGIPEETCQTEDDTETGVVSRGANQIVDNVVNKKFVLDTAVPVKDSVPSKRQCVRRQSTRFHVQEIEQTEKLPEIDDAEVTKKTTRLSLRRQSARLRPEESESCKSFHERDEVRETIKMRRVSSRQQSAGFDLQEPEVTETLKADDSRCVVSEKSAGSRSEAVEPSESIRGPKPKDTNGKRRVSTRRQSAKVTSQPATETNDEKTLQECDPIPSSVSQDDDHERESKKKPQADETEGMMRRTSVGRPSRHAAEKIQSYREVSLKVKMRRK